MGFLVGAALAAVVAGVAWWTQRSAQARHAALVGTETSTIGTLLELASAASGAAGPDSYRELVEVEGVVQAGPQGLLRSEPHQQPCVWYRQRTTRRYRSWSTDKDGRRTSTNQEEVVADECSDAPFVLSDGSGEVLVHPAVAVDGATKGHTLTRRGDGGDTLGYTLEEWLLPAGTTVFVAGEAAERGGRIEIGAPEGRDMVLSTRSETELLRAAAGSARTAGIVSKVAAVAAVVLAVVGAVGLL
ncbi:MAG: GIDE domain-containing protein [Nocardioides sp.]